MKRRGVHALAIGAALVLALAAGASSPREARAESTLGRLAGALFKQLDEALAASPPGDLGFYVHLGAPARALGPGRGEKLARALLELAAARYRSAAGVRSLDLAAGADVPDLATVGSARGVDVAVFIEADIAESFVVLAGDVVLTDGTPWARVGAAGAEAGGTAAAGAGVGAAAGTHVSAVAAKLFARERLDAELRFLLGAVPSKRSGKLRMDLYPQEGRDVLGLAVGDLDADGHAELVVLERERLRVLRWALPGEAPAKSAAAADDAPGFRVVADTPFARLPRAPERSRDAVGMLVVAPLDGDARPPVVLARTSDLASAHMFRLAAGALLPGATWSGWPVAVYRDRSAAGAGSAAPASEGTVWLGAELGAGGAVFGPGLPAELVGADGKRTRLDSIDAGTAFLARVRRVVRGAVGERVVTAMVDERGRLSIVEGRDGGDGESVARFAGPVGYALDAGDLDDDGKVEVAVAAGAPPGDPDEVLLFDVDRGKLTERWRSGAVEGEVRALTIGDVDHDGRIDVVAAVRGPDGRASLLVIARD